MTELGKNYMVLTSPGLKVASPGANWNFFHDPSKVDFDLVESLFVISQASAIGSLIDLVKMAIDKRKLAGIFLKQDLKVPEWPFKQLASSLSPKLLKKALAVTVTANDEVLKRLLLAHDENRVKERIANIHADSKNLYITGCDLKEYVIPKALVPVLEPLNKTQFKDFEIDSRGERLHWPSHDLHLNLEGLRKYIDPELRRILDQKNKAYLEKFGKALRFVRKKYKISQKDIGTPGDREIRRIEKGEVFPHTNTLRDLAKAHGLPMADYLQEISKALGSH